MKNRIKKSHSILERQMGKRGTLMYNFPKM